MIAQETLFERFFSLNGRMNRKRYFFSIIIYMFMAFFIGSFAGLLEWALANFAGLDFREIHIFSDNMGLLASISMLIILYMGFVIMVKRFHDLNCGIVVVIIVEVLGHAFPNLVLFGIVNPLEHLMEISISLIFSSIIGLFLFFKKGTVGENKYGPDPLGNSLINTTVKYASKPTSALAKQSDIPDQQPPKAYAAFSEDMFEEAAHELHVNPSTLGAESNDVSPTDHENGEQDNAEASDEPVVEEVKTETKQLF